MIALAAFGLVWRLAPLGLPYIWWAYGGGVIWGAMLVPLVGTFSVGARRPAFAGLAAAAIALAAEYQRLWHDPHIDMFRRTLAGGLLLGRIFNPRNLLAYWTGISFAILAQTLWSLRMAPSKP